MECSILLYGKLQRAKCRLQRRDGYPGAAPLSQGGSSVFKDRPIVNTNIDVPIIGRGFNDGDGSVSAKDCGSSCQMECSCKDCLWTCFGTEGDLSRGMMIG